MDGKQFWSEETYTLRNVVYDIGLPTVVKVSEGIYNDNEVETFSCGDLIKLDFQKSITKVSAQFLDEQTMSESIVDEFGYHLLKEEILIPLDYRGRVTVMQPQGRKNRFYSVKELANIFPKHVRVDKPIKVYADNRTVKLKTGAILELDRVLPSVGLVCRLDGKDIMLNLKQKGKFTQTASDDTTYSLKEIVDNFPLPQYVKILDKEFQKMATEDLDDVLDEEEDIYEDAITPAKPNVRFN
ncbi:hypothetical protein KUTeg_016705 [Tegillarca granosa]|uniref:CABIT domain-containing protein n=1 Tax=Tegillarca granosa TaxID=220873 RepID=A0ABQ9ERI0_TEGGR|nr:hypothetical protein KUTeg_016705 [Tegillarca granosa]